MKLVQVSLLLLSAWAINAIDFPEGAAICDFSNPEENNVTPDTEEANKVTPVICFPFRPREEEEEKEEEVEKVTPVICDPMRPPENDEVTPVICDPMRPTEEESVVTPVICDPMRPVEGRVTPVICPFPVSFEEETRATESTPVRATSPPPLNNLKTCDCVLRGSNPSKLVSANDLLGGQYLGYSTPFGKCNSEALDECAQQCKLFFPAHTNDFDLKSTSRSEPGSLASRICSKFVTQPFFSKVDLLAQLKCVPAGVLVERTLLSRNLMSSKQRLSCFGSRALTFPF